MSILERVRRKLGSAPALRSLALAAVAVAALSAIGAAPALAQERHWRGDGYRHHDRGWVNWRGGHWFRGPHEGRLGWWWIAGNAWYYYPAPVYPYPAYAAAGPITTAAIRRAITQCDALCHALADRPETPIGSAQATERPAPSEDEAGQAGRSAARARSRLWRARRHN